MRLFFRIKNSIAIFFIIYFCIFTFGCKGKTSNQESTPDDESYFNSMTTSSISYADAFSSVSLSDDYYRRERTPIHNRINPVDVRTLQFTVSAAAAHKKYLNDPLAFRDLPDGGVPSGNTAVVGSDVCRFYPVESISSTAEISKLPLGDLIPFASIIPLGDELRNSDSRGSMNGMFDFQDNYNYFYKTTWNGIQGIVFGADLFGINHSNESNRINSLLYKNEGKYDNFYSFTGYNKIRDDIKGELQTNGLAFQEVKHSEYNLSLYSPDDMISLYKQLSSDNQTSIFVTTDLAAHASHLIFDRLLQYLEEEYFYPQLVALTDAYISAIEERRLHVSENIYSTSILYFLTAKALLALAPKRLQDDNYGRLIQYQDADKNEVLKVYPEQVKAEIQKMNGAQGIGQSEIFPLLKEDYSQYKVRGHYTKNGVLGAYFRALMWYGRINFNLGGDENIRPFAEQFAPAALFITDITENTQVIKNLWSSLFDPITELIGVSDDISFHELIPLWNRIKGAGFNQWYSDPEKVKRFITTEYSELRSPAISGFPLTSGPYAGGSDYQDRKPPVGWRLFGQRYTVDSEIHHHLSPPRYYNEENPRHMVCGLDIMKVFGSVTADRILKESEFKKYAGLETVMNSLQQSLARVNRDYWFSTYYGNVLYQIKTLATFENGAGFYFTEKPGWGLKAMNSSHGTWAELRHDTILYVKQGYAEMGGGGPDVTFRTKPLPKPVHYIEPNVPFWNASIISFQKLFSILEKYDYLDGTTARVLAGMHELCVKAAEISKLQAEDRAISESDLNWISRIADSLSNMVLTHTDGGTLDDVNSLRMALVADVFTNGETGKVLETAVGIPYRLYIPLNDGQGGKRIAIGYGFSYYEFQQPISQRLNNDEWKEIVYRENSNMNNYLPFWMQGKVQRPK